MGGLTWPEIVFGVVLLVVGLGAELWIDVLRDRWVDRPEVKRPKRPEFLSGFTTVSPNSTANAAKKIIDQWCEEGVVREPLDHDPLDRRLGRRRP